MEYALMNGVIQAKSACYIQLEDRGYQFGDGVYEVIRVYNRQIFYIKQHLERLKSSAEQIAISLPLTLAELEGQLQELVEKNSLVNGKIYMQVTRGVSKRNHTFPEDAQPVLTAYTDVVDRPLDKLEQGMKAITLEDNRWLRVDIKSLNLLPNVIAKQEAKRQGGDEALFVRDGWVTEGSASNVFGIKEGTVYTHPANHYILNGITRQIVQELVAEEGLLWKEQASTAFELLDMDEVFITNTIVEVCPVISIDGSKVGAGTPGPLTRKLQLAYERRIQQD